MAVLLPRAVLRLPGNTFFDTLTLAVTGTYTIVVNPWSTNAGGLTLTLYDVPADATGTITTGGPPVTVTTTIPGHNARLTFAGTANQTVTLQLSNSSYGSNGVYVSILKPDSSILLPPTWISSSLTLPAQTLPVTGTYTITFDPYLNAVGSITATFLAPAVLVNGTAPPTVVTVQPGASVTVSVSGGPATPNDWVALAQVGSGNTSYITYQYLPGITSSATLTFSMPATPRNYEFRFFANNGYTRLATSTMVTVQ